MPDDATPLYTLKQATAATGLSRGAVRQYCARYARWLSTYATPAPGLERQFTRDDLRVFRFVRDVTATGAGHDAVVEQLQSGALDAFTWQPPEDVPSAADVQGDAGAYLVPVERLQAAQALLGDAQRRESDAAAKLEQAQAEIARLNRELGEARGALSVYEKRKRPRWLASLFGE